MRKKAEGMTQFDIFHISRLLAPAYDDGLMSPRSRSVQGMSTISESNEN